MSPSGTVIAAIDHHLSTGDEARTGPPRLAVDHLAIARQYAAHREEWPLAPRFDPLQRWYHRLAVTPDAEVWLLTWLPGQHTDLHDHGGSAGAFLVLSGVLTEYTATGQPDGQARLVPEVLSDPRGRSFGAHHVHRIVNAGVRPAVSLHVYGPALSTMTRYRLDGAHLRATTVERAGADW